MTKVKGSGYHQGQVMDVADYVFPSQVRAAENAGGDISRGPVIFFYLITRLSSASFIFCDAFYYILSET